MFGERKVGCPRGKHIISVLKHSHSHSDHQRSSFIPHLSLVYCTKSMSKRSAIYKRISSKFQSKSSASGNTLNNEFPSDWKSPALDNAKMIFQLASNLGSGTLSIPGLQAAGLIGVQIIDAVKVSIIIYFCFSDMTEFYLQKFKSNKQDAEDLVIHISKLMEPILNALQNKTVQDIDPNLAVNLLRFQKYVNQNL